MRGTRHRSRRRRSIDSPTWCKDDLERVNALIIERMQSPVSLIPQLAGHIIAAGGKRLRPMLTLATARMCGYRGSRHVALAAAVEFIHTATLLHDDVVDASDLRRGLATANAVWGNKPSVLVGDFLFSRAFQLMVEDGSLKVLDILSRASAVIAEGEVLQLVTSNDIDTHRGGLSPRHRRQDGGALRRGEPHRRRARRAVRKRRSERSNAYGRNLGIAFQLVDDMLDYSAREVELGKAIGDDFREGKITLPIVLALRAGRRARAPVLAPHARAARSARRAISNARSRLIDRHGTLAATLARAADYAGEARRALAAFRPGPEQQALDEVIDFCLERGYLSAADQRDSLQAARKRLYRAAPECSSAW